MNYLKFNISNFYQEYQKWTCEESCWTIHSVLQHRLVISGIAPCGESRYFPLPKGLRNPVKGLINSKSEDKECFR